jgi:thiol:disulfide interchange protein
MEPSPRLCYTTSMRALAMALSLVVMIPVVGCDADAKASINKALGRYRAYDGKAVPAEQMAKALATAKTEQKRVLVQFGGNWCVFCQALDELIDHDATLKGLRDQYVNVHIDAGSADDMNQRYGKPFDFGFPVLLVFEADGTLLHTQPSTSFQLPTAVGHDPAGVAAFLKSWAH